MDAMTKEIISKKTVINWLFRGLSDVTLPPSWESVTRPIMQNNQPEPESLSKRINPRIIHMTPAPLLVRPTVVDIL